MSNQNNFHLNSAKMMPNEFNIKYLDSADLQPSTSVPNKFEKELNETFHFVEDLFSVDTDQGSMFELDNELGFLTIIKPVIISYAVQLEAMLEKGGITSQYKPYKNLGQSMTAKMLPLLYSTLAPLFSRTLILELHIAKLQGKLQGRTSKLRYKSFIQQLKNKDTALAILKQYPLLLYRAVLTINYWQSNSFELLKRLLQDYHLLENRFSEKHLGNLLTVDGGVGDSHKKGKSVLIITFDSREKIIYKPRSLGLDELYSALIKWTNNKQPSLNLRSAKSLNRGSYGWVEYVENKACQSLEEVNQFYKRLGSQLALLYLFNAGDMHFENIIAHGAHPVFIDLETFCSPRLNLILEPYSNFSNHNPPPASVTSLLLLPNKMWGNDKEQGVDVSGITAKQGAKIPIKAESVINHHTDEIRLENHQMELIGDKHIPTFGNREIDPYDYCDEIISGFRQTYLLLFKYSSELLDLLTQQNKINKLEARCLFKPTQFYSLFLSALQHPDYLKDINCISRLMKKLGLNKNQGAVQYFILKSELKDLLRVDIPFFTSPLFKRIINNGESQSFSEGLKKSGYECLLERLNRLGYNDLRVQEWAIKSSFITTQTSLKNKTPLFKIKKERSCHLKTTLQIAIQIAEELIKNSVGNNWMGVRSPQAGKTLGVSWVDNSFHDGRMGVALFFAQIYALTLKRKYKNLATSMTKEILNWLVNSTEFLTKEGGVNSLAGIIYSACKISQLTNTPEFLLKIPILVQLIEASIEKDQRFDVMSGVAGCILSLESIYRKTKDNYLIKVIKKCANHLTFNVTNYATGVGWPCDSKSMALSGFAHGCAGHTAALYCASNLLKDKKLAKLAAQCWDYEQSLFSSEVGNWLDIREIVINNSFKNDRPNLIAWCHGAAGIGLGRIRMFNYLQLKNEKNRALKDIKTAIKKTLSYHWLNNHSLCHGAFGNIELLLSSRDIIDDKRLEFQIKNISQSLIKHIQEEGIIGGSDFELNEFGFMNGIAGVGYQLLRLAFPEKVESVITFK